MTFKLLLFIVSFSSILLPSLIKAQEQAPAEINADLQQNDAPSEPNLQPDSPQETSNADTPESNDANNTNNLNQWPQPPSFAQQQASDLSTLYLPDQTLLLGEEPRFAVVLQHATNSPVLGTAVIFPQWDSTPFSESKMPMIQTLLSKGWHVISLVPQQAIQLSGDETEDQKIWSDYLTSVAAQVTELKKLPELQVGFSLIIAEHNMAAVILALYAQNLSPLPDALILLNAQASDPTNNKKMAQQLTALSIPILDIYQQNGPYHLEDSSQLRAQRAKASGKYNYRQRALTSVFFNDYIGIEINGWTHHLGWQ